MRTQIILLMMDATGEFNQGELEELEETGEIDISTLNNQSNDISNVDTDLDSKADVEP